MSTPAIFLDDEATWPTDLRRILEKGLPTLRKFYAEDARIEKQQRGDVMLRIYEPHNPYRESRDEILAEFERALSGLFIVGWHCTRLCKDEVKLIFKEGMYPLSPETFGARLNRRFAAGDISTTEREMFEKINQVDDVNRQMLWFIFSRNLLRDESGVGRLFTSWGGEALYNSHENDVRYGAILRSIGQPYIVEAEMPISKIDAHWEPAEWISRPFLDRRGIRDGHSPERNGHIHERIEADRIRRLISIDDPIFDELTKSASWKRYPLR